MLSLFLPYFLSTFLLHLPPASTCPRAIFTHCCSFPRTCSPKRSFPGRTENLQGVNLSHEYESWPYPLGPIPSWGEKEGYRVRGWRQETYGANPEQKDGKAENHILAHYFQAAKSLVAPTSHLESDSGDTSRQKMLFIKCLWIIF